MYLFSLIRLEQTAKTTRGILCRTTEDPETGKLTSVAMCHTLEDIHRAIKVAGETRIPAGKYELRKREHGGFHRRYAARFPWHRGMIEICEIPGFTDVLIHTGNRHVHTAGCLLVGMSWQRNAHEHFLMRSTEAYELIYPEIMARIEQGPTFLEVVDDC